MLKPFRNQRLADTILMVEPHDFDYNPETGKDNEFQKEPAPQIKNINTKAMDEFNNMVEILRNEGVNVLVLGKSKSAWIQTPDAVFPNNWFSTERDGNVVLYPMLAENRRAEKRIRAVENLLTRNGFYVRNIINIGRLDESDMCLEGTGSMIIDHANDVVYAARSKRCHPVQFANFLDLREYGQGLMFDTRSSGGFPIYHTNVMLSIGEQFSVICSECIPDLEERQTVLDSLENSHHVIDITIEQMEQNFCGNILQLRNKARERLIVMSQNAHDGFTEEQRETMRKYGKLVAIPLETIETVGGGSARCMMAEVFLPSLKDKPKESEVPL